jgi:hypothetical protein
MHPAYSPLGPVPEPEEVERAFDVAIEAELTAKGWQPARKSHLLPLSEDFNAHLSFSRAVVQLPIEVVPAIGVCYLPVQNFLADHLTELHRDDATLSDYIAQLAPSPDMGFVDVGSVADAHRAAVEVVDLVERYGLPWVRQYDSIAPLLEEISQPRNCLPGWQRFRLAAMHFLLGHLDTAQTLVNKDLLDLSAQLDPGRLIAAYHYLAAEITAHRDP